MGDYHVYQLQDVHERLRFQEIENYYETCFQQKPEFYVRCPGRVNLIGEHIDYSGFGVLPIAIEKDVKLAVGVNDDGKLKIYNFEEKYKPCIVSVENMSISKNCPEWYEYIFCGYKGIAEKFELRQKSFNIAIKGTIPPGAGLSSSSALVCAGALATCFINRISVSKLELAKICAASECYIGTQGGGMDQAIIFLAEPGFAKFIEFSPLSATNIVLPEGLEFVVAHSGISINKAATTDFNQRVVECKLAAKALASFHNFKWQDSDKLGQIQSVLQKQSFEMSEISKKLLTLKPWERTEIRSLLKISELELQELLKDIKADEHVANFKTYKIGSRAYHVYNESENVRLFIEACKIAHYENIGKILNDSHDSLRLHYECSHLKLDALRDAMLKAGCIGARLTGAGWGGCIVAAVKKNDVGHVMEKIKAYHCEQGIGPDDLFLTKPSGGAAVYI